MLTMELFTPTEKKVMAVLGDGLPHSVKQCLEGMDDPMYTYENLLAHLKNINHKLRVRGHEVVFVKVQGRMCYRLIRHVASSLE